MRDGHGSWALNRMRKLKERVTEIVGRIKQKCGNMSPESGRASDPSSFPVPGWFSTEATVHFLHKVLLFFHVLL